MRARLVGASVTVLMVLAGAAQAEILASGPMATSSGSNTVTCRLFNAGLVSVNIISRQIFSETGSGASTLASNNCGASLAPLKSCGFSANFGGSFVVSCRAIVTGNDVQVKGSAEISTTGGIFNSQPMH